MTIVIDASVAVTWSLRDEARPDLDEVLVGIQGTGAVVPPIWFFEIANVLIGAARRGRMPFALVDGELRALAALPIVIDDNATGAAFRSVIALALRHGLTVYDASYLEVALRRGVPLATLDHQLRFAAAREKVTLVPSEDAG